MFKRILVTCCCGCGESYMAIKKSPSVIKRHGEKYYKKGHYLRGKKKSKEQIKKISENKKGTGIGINNPNWKGGISKSGEYVLIYSPNHPNARKDGYVTEHRLIMEKHIGRYLEQNEYVHHINHNKQDNRIENLTLCSHKNHMKIHREGKKFPRKNGTYFICERCGKKFYKSHWYSNPINRGKPYKVRFCSWKCRYNK